MSFDGFPRRAFGFGDAVGDQAARDPIRSYYRTLLGRADNQILPWEINDRADRVVNGSSDLATEYQNIYNSEEGNAFRSTGHVWPSILGKHYDANGTLVDDNAPTPPSIEEPPHNPIDPLPSPSNPPVIVSQPPVAGSSPVSFVTSIENSVSGFIDGISAHFGINKRYVEIGAVGLVFVGVWYSGILSGGGRRR